MRLVDLEPQFLRYEMQEHDQATSAIIREPGKYPVFVSVPTIAEAQGVEFLCPKCFVTKGGPIGTHAVICWSSSAGVPDDAQPGPGRWKLVGTGFADLTLAEEPGKSRSVALNCECLEPDGSKGPGWHGYITGGEATNA